MTAAIAIGCGDHIRRHECPRFEGLMKEGERQLDPRAPAELEDSLMIL